MHVKMEKKTTGFCKYCGKEYTRDSMIQHLNSCKEREAEQNAQAGKRKCGYFDLIISDRHNSSYWLIIEMRETAMLKDLDRFIRDIWAECCMHLSLFMIEGGQYGTEEMDEIF